MGKLVQFEKRKRMTTRPASADREEGKVLLFTGVRYERAPKPDKPPAARTRRKRV